MKEIPLTQDRVAFIDDEDYEEIVKFKWFASKSSSKIYAMRRDKSNKGIQMHRQLTNCPKGFVVLNVL